MALLTNLWFPQNMTLGNWVPTLKLVNQLVEQKVNSTVNAWNKQM